MKHRLYRTLVNNVGRQTNARKHAADTWTFGSRHQEPYLRKYFEVQTQTLSTQGKCCSNVANSTASGPEIKYTLCLGTTVNNSTEQSPSWEANGSPASQDIPGILRDPAVHNRNHKSPPPTSILRQIDPVYVPHPTSRRSILILSSNLRLGLPSGLLLSGFPTKTLYAPLLSPIRATCPAHLILIWSPTGICWGVQSMKRLVT